MLFSIVAYTGRKSATLIPVLVASFEALSNGPNMGLNATVNAQSTIRPEAETVGINLKLRKTKLKLFPFHKYMVLEFVTTIQQSFNCKCVSDLAV